MAYHIEKCVPTDAEALAKLHLAVSTTAPRFHVTYGACHEGDLLSTWTHELQTAISGQTKHDAGLPQKQHYLKAVDPMTNEIVAYVVWTFLPNGYHYLDDPELYRESSPQPEGVNVAVLKDFSGKIEGLRRKYAEGIKPLWLLAVLGTHPDHRGKGLAGQLIRSMFPRADAEGVTCYVDSSAAGLPVYQKCGFEAVDSINLDLEKYSGGEGLGKPEWTALLRQPIRTT